MKKVGSVQCALERNFPRRGERVRVRPSAFLAARGRERESPWPGAEEHGTRHFEEDGRAGVSQHSGYFVISCFSRDTI